MISFRFNSGGGWDQLRGAHRGRVVRPGGAEHRLPLPDLLVLDNGLGAAANVDALRGLSLLV